MKRIIHPHLLIFALLTASCALFLLIITACNKEQNSPAFSNVTGTAPKTNPPIDSLSFSKSRLVEGNWNNPDSFARPVTFPVRGKPKVVKAQTNMVPAGKPDARPISIRPKTLTPGKDGLKAPVVKPAQGRIVPALHRPLIAATPPKMKDGAVADLQYLDQSNGLPDPFIVSLFEDSRGYLWIGSLGSGLSRYDGSGFAHFSTAEGLASNPVPSILEDRRGNLWFATLGGGIHRYDGRQFIIFDEDGGLVDNDVLSLLEDRNGRLWIGTWGGGVCRFEPDSLDPTKGVFTHFTSEQGLSHDHIWSILEDHRGDIWFATNGGGVCRFDGEHFTHYTQEAGLLSNSTNSLLEDDRGRMWIGTSRGINIYESQGGEGLGVMTSYTKTHGLSDNSNKSLLKDKRGVLWVGTFRKGVLNYQTAEQENQSVFMHYSPSEGLTTGHVEPIIEDSKGNIWIGTWGGGLNRYKEESFKHYGLKTGLSGSDIRAVFADSKGRLWFGAKEEGVNMYDGRQFTYYGVQEGLTHPNVKAIFEDSQGNLWFGTSIGINRFDGANFTQFTRKEGLALSDVRAIVEDKQKRIWIAGGNIGFTCFDGESFTYYREEHGLVDRRIWCMLSDSKGHLWIGTHDGLSRFTPHENGRKGRFTNFGRDDGLSDVYIESALEDSQGVLWFGTHNGGVNRYDGERFTHYSVEHGLGHNTVRSITEDSLGNLWLVTPKGVSLMRRPSGSRQKEAEVQFYNFETSDGLKNTMNTEVDNSVCLDRNNRLWMGNTSGVAMLDLNRYVLPKDPPQIYLNNIEVNQTFVDYNRLGDQNYRQSLDFGKSLAEAFDSTAAFANYPKSMSLPHRLNHLTFYFAAIDWAAPQKIKYRFRMEGLNEDWSSLSSETKADYRNLPPGKYTFLVKASGGTQIWSETLRYSFHIRPPWYWARWSKILYLLILSSGLYAIYRFQLSRQLKNQFAAAETRRLKELDVVKTKLYTNITHEFRTPLTVILGMADQIKDQVGDTAKEGLQMIERNGRQLLNLVNQLLDLRKLESGSISVKMVQGDVLLYIKYVLESFHSYAESKNIRLHFMTDLKEMQMDYDPEKLLAILSNLLSNAIKFTPEGGDIYLSVASCQSSVIRGREPSSITHHPSSIDPHPSSIIIRLRDTGAGIAEDKLPYIFDRFYQVDDESTRKAEGTGIGLALIKELVKLLGGQISVESEPGKGTEFKILLPVSRQAEPIEVMEPLHTAEVAEAVMPVTGMTLAGQSDQALVLIIEDNSDVRSYLQSCLSGDYRLMMAEDGRIGIEKALAEIPDLIISDVMMPHKDGFEVCETLKNDERASHIPIILLTAKADVESRLSGLKRGADAYLAKPFHKEELLIRIGALLEQRRKLQTYYLSQALADRASTATEETSEDAAVENAFVLKIRKIVEARLDDPSFSVEQLCREAALSQAQLFRKLKALLGKSAGELIRSIRLAKAKELLQDPELSITAVAYDTGFNDPLYFSKVFRKEFGMTPTAYREGL